MHVIIGINKKFPLTDKSNRKLNDNEQRRHVIPLSMFGKTLKSLIDNITSQINNRDYHFSQQQNYKYDPQIVHQIVGIEKSVFHKICTKDNDENAFDDVHIFTCDTTQWVGI